MRGSSLAAVFTGKNAAKAELINMGKQRCHVSKLSCALQLGRFRKSKPTDLSQAIALEPRCTFARDNIIVRNKPTLRTATYAVIHVYGFAM